MFDGFNFFFNSVIDLKGIVDERPDHKEYQNVLNRIEIVELDSYVVLAECKNENNTIVPDQLIALEVSPNSQNHNNGISTQEHVRENTEEICDQSQDKSATGNKGIFYDEFSNAGNEGFSVPVKNECHDTNGVSEKEPEKDSDEQYVLSLMERILNNLDDFKCLHQSVKSQRTEQDKYYNSTYIESVNVNNISEYSVGQSDKICSFVLKIYSISYQAIMFLNEVIDRKSDYWKQLRFSNRLMKIIINLKDNFLKIVSKETKYLSFKKMALNIAIVLLNSNRLLVSTDKNAKHLERIMNVVVTELNIFAIKNCNQLEFNFLLHNNMDFIDFGKGDVENYMTELFKNIEENSDSKKSDAKDMNGNNYEHNSIKIQYLYDTYVKESQVFKSYGKNVTFFWKGKKMSSTQIFEELVFFILNPYDVYLFYDVYFKFYIAVIYYEINLILEKNNYKIMKNGFSELNKILSEFRLEFFPEKFHYLIKDIHTILKIQFETYSSQETAVTPDKLKLDNLFIVQKRINTKFVDFGIELKKNTIFTTAKKSFMHLDIFRASIKAFSVINFCLGKYVNDLNKRFSKLRNIIPSQNFFEDN